MPDPPNATALLDAAFAIGKDTTGYAREMQKEMRALVAAKFPDAAPRAVAHACTLARGLLTTCYAVGEAYRNDAITHGSAQKQLAERYPGFSPVTYRSAVSYGAFISR